MKYRKLDDIRHVMAVGNSNCRENLNYCPFGPVPLQTSELSPTRKPWQRSGSCSGAAMSVPTASGLWPVFVTIIRWLYRVHTG